MVYLVRNEDFDVARGVFSLFFARRCILADESHHRDVNHVFASMKVDDPNPFVSRHLEDAYTAWQYDIF